MYIDFIPAFIYSDVYFHIIMVITLYTFIILQSGRFKVADYGGIVLIFVLLYLGLRPLSYVFGDMLTYSRSFEDYARGATVEAEKDVFFHWFMYLSSKIMDVHAFFMVCAALYILPLFYACKRWFGDYWFYGFLMAIGSFSFWAYGTNGIRNGIATSFFLLAISIDKRFFQYVWIALAVSVHKSLLLPAAGWIATSITNRPRLYYYFWLLTIPLSLGLPGFWERLFAGLVEDERSVYFTDTQYSEQFSKVGFRWDFLLYSSMGVGAGWFYILKEKVMDEVYIRLFNTFLFANAFWVLVIRASFSNRFAYLSWFMMAIIIVYPLLKFQLFPNQGVKFSLVLLFYYLFTYVMIIFIY